LRTLLALAVGRALRVLVRLVRKGGGSALPGLVVSKLAPGLLAQTLKKFPDGLVVVTGSAGKSTTTKMLVAIVRKHGVEVFTNPSTANILQGFYSSIVEQASPTGSLPGRIAILEMDEAHAEELTRSVSPRLVTVLNVMEDQLDRFVDPELVRNDLGLVGARALEHLVLNADDPNLRVMLQQHPSRAQVSWFGVDAPSLATERFGLATAPVYSEVPERPAPIAEVRNLKGQTFSAHLKGHGDALLTLPNRGLHFALDAIAALESARTLLGEEFDYQLAVKTLADLPPVFARGEISEVRGQKVEFILVQNPGSMQLNIDNLEGDPEQILFAIGRDVHDPSWMWTVDYSNLSHVDVVTGLQADQAALLLRYHDIPVGDVEHDLEQAIDRFFGLPEPKRGHKTVIFSADSMRRMRRSLGFWSPEDVQR
jgi:lipid II isoglutaminyl synthase (glutamine-hydrolysing)